jgi:CRISPR system Cascade subunit CasD
MRANTLFLRLEGPLQAWGDHQSKFVIRRTAEAPTKSGVIGMLCAALRISRAEAPKDWLPKLCTLCMAVRIDSPGVRWWDYHTVGAKVGILRADGAGIKRTAATGEIETLITRREYLCDASFLVALQGEPQLIAQVKAAVEAPKWPLYLGRKCCSPSRPLLEKPATGEFPDLLSALESIPWRKRRKEDQPPETVDCLLDWQPTADQPEAPDDAFVWYDVPRTFEPPSHEPRFVLRRQLPVAVEGGVGVAGQPAQTETPPPPRPRADYTNSAYRYKRLARLARDQQLCVFCKAPAKTVQHITYRRAGGAESLEDLRSLCRLCHDAVTMIEYGLNMGLDRINPEEPCWRDRIIEKRKEIIKFRSLETRRRKLEAEEVE